MTAEFEVHPFGSLGASDPSLSGAADYRFRPATPNPAYAYDGTPVWRQSPPEDASSAPYYGPVILTNMAYRPGPSTQRPPQRGREFRPGGLAMGAVAIGTGAAVVAVMLAVGPSSASGGSPFSAGLAYHSTFKPSDGWRTGDLASLAPATATLTSQGYQVNASGLFHHILLTPYLNRNPDVEATASATGYPRSQISLGVGCLSSAESPYDAYQLSVYPNGDWFLEQAVPGGADGGLVVSTLDLGTTAPLGSSATFALTCHNTSVSGGTTVTQLTGAIDGHQVVSDPESQTDLPAAGWMPIMLMGSYGTTVTATFTSFSVRNA